MLNHITIGGRLTADPELKKTPNEISIASFSVAVERDYTSGEKQTDFIPCVAWRGTAEFISKYFRKGDMIIISGRLQIRKYTDKSGAARSIAEVVTDTAYFCGSKKSGDSSGQADEVDFDVDDGELPF